LLSSCPDLYSFPELSLNGPGYLWLCIFKLCSFSPRVLAFPAKVEMRKPIFAPPFSKLLSFNLPNSLCLPPPPALSDPKLSRLPQNFIISMEANTLQSRFSCFRLRLFPCTISPSMHTNMYLIPRGLPFCQVSRGDAVPSFTGSPPGAFRFLFILNFPSI